MAFALPSDVVVTGIAEVVTVNPTRAHRMDRLCAFSVAAARAALVDSALLPSDDVPDPALPSVGWNPERTGIVFGTAYGCHATNEHYYRGLLDGGPTGASPRLFAYTLPSSPVGEISIAHQIRGPVSTLACLTAGSEAMAEGLRQIRRNRADRVLVVAAEIVTPLLAELLGDDAAGAADVAAAIVLERATAPRIGLRTGEPRGSLFGVASAFCPSDRASAVRAATEQLLTSLAVRPSAIEVVLGDAADVAGIAALGLPSAATAPIPRALGAQALLVATRWLRAGKGLALIVHGAPEGAGAALLLATSPL